ncbi:hypothetical protein [Micromonospora auratinigra]|uniref:SWIM-type domain-containing protein n=1 Tax=Micromonospora auratinigra TaxID=261654 RepID=A0A1A8Z7H6_9ACTN|nr:hypothetical protein [Micromonospora auratinigra]SBT39782.1 hypothetical protein GA0070611_1022 [Micromonospora auratinigra]
MIRTDLLALTPEVLAALSNRGLVKRAAKAVDGGEAPTLTVGDDGVVHATHPDGTTSTLPAVGGLAAGVCSCAAPGVCRHLLALVLTYQRQQEAATEPAPASTPARSLDGSGGAGDPTDRSPAGRAPAIDDPAGPALEGSGPAERDGPGGTGTAPAERDRPEGGDTCVAGLRGGGGPGGEQHPPGGGHEPWRWSPGEFTDDELTAALGAPALAAAGRRRRAGYTALVRRPGPADPVPQVELPTGTVRFLVPHQLGYARSDAAGGEGEAVALAVWACRVADREQSDRREAQVRVGGPAAVVDVSALDAAVALAAEVLLAGAVHTGAGAATRLAAVRRDLDAAGLRWPLLALDDLAGQLDAYAARSARYRPETLAEVLAELPARQRAVLRGGATPAQRVLGADEPAETPLRRLRLTGLGARVGDTGGEVVVDVVLAHPTAAGVLVLRREFPAAEEDRLTGHTLAGRRVAGSTLGALAAGNVVSEAAVRSAAHRLRFAAGRLARTAVTPGTGSSWAELPPALLAGDLDALAASLAERPPRLLRPRTAAESVRVLALGEVRSIGYAAGEQRLDATVTGAAGGVATVSAVHRAAAPGALDALAAALRGEHGTPRYVSGTVRRGANGLVVEVLAVVADTVVVPDLAAGTGDGILTGTLADRPDPVAAALRAGSALLAQAAHRGLRQLPAGFRDRLRAAGAGLARVGLDRCGAALTDLAGALGADPGDAAVRAWVDAQIRLLVTAESR